MNRSKREIKTPKRFDEEPFEAPKKAPIVVEPPPKTPAPPKQPSTWAKQHAPWIKLPKLGPKKHAPTDTPTLKAEPIIKTPTAKETASQKISSEEALAVKSPAIKLPTIKLPALRQTSITRGPTIKLPSVRSPATKTPALKTPPVKVPVVQKVVVDEVAPAIKSPAIKSPAAKAATPKTVGPRARITKSPPFAKSHSFKNSKRRRPNTPPAYEHLIPNVVLPFWDARTAADEHEDDNVKELVHCHCGIPEELGLMVQCETCLTWQHAHCLGFEQEEDAPDGYTCQACSDPKFARDSMRWAYDQDWLTRGKMKQFSCDKSSHQHETALLQKINKLIDDSLKLCQLIHSLRVKTKILHKAVDLDDPELKLFRVQWPASYFHRDGTLFVPSLTQLPNSPASTMSAMAGTPDPGDLPVEAVADLRGALPDIGQLDVSAILDNTDIPIMPASNEPASDDCRSNLKLHMKQTEEFISIELNHISEEIAALEKEVSQSPEPKHKINFESIKNDLMSMKRYLEQKGD